MTAIEEIERLILHDIDLWLAVGQEAVEAAVKPLAVRILAATGSGRLTETFNEYGTPVTLYRCGSCAGTFTVCPAVAPEHDDQWAGCLGETCGSYDPHRDGDKLFDAGRVHRVGDRSHLTLVVSSAADTSQPGTKRSEVNPNIQGPSS